MDKANTEEVPDRSPTGSGDDRLERPTGFLWKPMAIGIALAVVIATFESVVFSLTGIYATDFKVFHGVGNAVANGDSPYDFVTHQGLQFLYPPFSAALFTGMSPLSLTAAFWLWTTLSVLSIEAVIWLFLSRLRVTGQGRRATLTLVVTVAALPLTAISQSLGLGQINLILMLLVVADLLWVGRRGVGIAIGIAAGIKLTPLIFIPYLFFTRGVRPALVATGTFAGTVATGFLLLPEASIRYWGGTFVDMSRMGPPHVNVVVLNQSLRGLAVRLDESAGLLTWLPLSVLVAGAGLALAVRVSRRGWEPAGVVACALTGLVASPVSWEMQWVWCVPSILLVASWARRHGGLGAKLGVVVLGVAFVPSFAWLDAWTEGGLEGARNTWLLPLTNLYLVIGGVLLVLIGILHARMNSPLASIHHSCAQLDTERSGSI